MVDAWKDARLPEKQIALNRKELNGAYPQHWRDLLQCLRSGKTPLGLPFYDVGCGVGATYALLQQERIPVEYLGLDFSEAMIATARAAWGAPDAFQVDDYRTWTRDLSDGILYCTGLLDIVEDGVKELRRLLSFGCPTVILNRVNIGQTASLRSYHAYDTIPAFSYTFAYQEFIDVIKSLGYSIEYLTSSGCYLLRKNMP